MVPTARVAFSFEGQANRSEEWAVLNDARTLSPHFESLTRPDHRRWFERIAGMKKMGFQWDGKADESLAQPTFETAELAEALSSVGCSY